MRAIVFLACALANPVFGESAKEFRFNIPVQPAGADGLQRIALPLAVYRGAHRADLGDLRLFNAHGEKLPFAFTGKSPLPVAIPEWLALPLFALPAPAVNAPVERLDLRIRQRADGTLVQLTAGGKAVAAKSRTNTWIADASQLGKDIKALRFAWMAPAAGVVTRVRIDASDDLSSWRQVSPGAPLVELVQADARLRQDRFELAPLKARYLRFTILGEPLAITSVEAELAPPVPERPMQVLSVAGTAGARDGEFLFDANARVPVERVQVRLPQPNTVAPLSVAAREDAKSDWRSVASATAYRLVRDGEEVVSPPFAIPRRTDRYWRVKFDQRGGGAGSGTVTLELGWSPQQLVFAARGPGPYVLAFGRAAIEAADYGIANLVPGYKPGAEFALPEATLGPVMENAVDVPAPGMEWLRSLDRKRAILWGLLAGAVLLLAAMAWGLSRQMKAPPEPPQDDRRP